MGQQFGGDIGADGLEPALGVAEPRCQCRAQEQVVAARDDLAPGAAHHPGTAPEPSADGKVGMTGDQRGDQWGQRGQIGRQVDVHVGQDRRVGDRPHRTQCPPAPLLLQPHHPHVRQFAGQRAGDPRCVVGAGVVGDGDPEREREVLAQMAVQPVDRVSQHGLFVEHRDDDIEHRHTAVGGDQRGISSTHRGNVGDGHALQHPVPDWAGG